MNKIIITGFPKCGTTSLEQYLIDKGADVLRHESLFCAGDGYGSYHSYNPIEWYNKNASDRKVVFILRNPIDRIFSLYNYKKYHQKGDYYEIKEKNLNEALIKRPYIVEQSNYDKYLNMWEDKEIFYFEDLIDKFNFPKLNSFNSRPSDEDVNIIKSHINYKIHSRYE